MLFFAAGGSFDIERINRLALTGQVSPGLLLAGAVLLFLGVMGKSAQFPLHIWIRPSTNG